MDNFLCEEFIERAKRYPKSGMLYYYARGFDRAVIDLERLLVDRKKGKVDLELVLAEAALPRDFEQQVIEWAIAKYGIPNPCPLKNDAGNTVLSIDLAKEFPMLPERRWPSLDTPYERLVPTLQEALALDEKSAKVFADFLGKEHREEGKVSKVARRVQVVAEVAQKDGREPLDLELQYLQEVFGFSPGKYQLRDHYNSDYVKRKVRGEIVEEFLVETDWSGSGIHKRPHVYFVAPKALGAMCPLRIVVGTWQFYGPRDGDGLISMDRSSHDDTYFTFMRGHPNPKGNFEEGIRALQTLAKYIDLNSDEIGRTMGTKGGGRRWLVNPTSRS